MIKRDVPYDPTMNDGLLTQDYVYQVPSKICTGHIKADWDRYVNSLNQKPSETSTGAELQTETTTSNELQTDTTTQTEANTTTTDPTAIQQTTN